MEKTMNYDTTVLEDTYLVSFGKKTPLVIDRGKGVDVWDLDGKKYLDFTSGWAVTSLGHAHPVTVSALFEQARKIVQNPDSSLTYSPPRGRLLAQLVRIFPPLLHHFFFSNSGAEANDAALKLARKITGRKKVVSTIRSFHGRTIGTTSVTGQAVQRDRYDVLVPHCETIPFNDLAAAMAAIDTETAAIIVEPVQGEGGIWVPGVDYLPQIARYCRAAGALLIVDEIQTGFWRTGPAFASIAQGVIPDFLTMAKGIAGGFPFGAVAVSADAASRIELGDHGGTYCGNPLGCAVAAETIRHLMAIDIETSVVRNGELCRNRLSALHRKYPALIREIRGQGLLWAIDFSDEAIAAQINEAALSRGLILNVKHGTIIRIFPALTISERELETGFGTLADSVAAVAG
jgi:acetylornithine/N-succinyldiaminopimelate aminotransferase